METFASFQERIHQIGTNLDSMMPDVIAIAIFVELEAMYKRRIFDNGLKSDGSQIGEYSNESGYYSKDKFIRKAAFKPHGKPNADGAKRTKNKTMFIAGGYSEFRSIQGRETKHINFKYSGSEERAFKTMKFGNAALFGNTDLNESIKIESQQERYGNTFELSEVEKQFIRDEIVDQAVVTIKVK